MSRQIEQLTSDQSLSFKGEFAVQYAHYLRKIGAQYLNGTIPVQNVQGYRSLKSRWMRIEQMANRLEALLQKQLRKQDWNTDEAAFIAGYGEDMAYLMGYFGNAHSPQDDSPRWVEIANYPNKGSLFAVATGRPHVIYVLYPWHGIEVLCSGTVLPYFEYEGNSRLTDDEWTQTLDKPDAVPRPGWAAPLYLTP